jgi:hypothetical protein
MAHVDQIDDMAVLRSLAAAGLADSYSGDDQYFDDCWENYGEDLVPEENFGCGHSICSQNYIDTGNRQCIAGEETA